MRGATTLLCAVAVAIVAAAMMAGAQEPTKREDPFDLSGIRKSIQEAGVPTPTTVGALEQRAAQLMEAKDCTKALPVLEELARHSNWLANLIAGGLEPYYRASYDAKKHTSVSQLVGFETLSNSYKSKRNKAMVMQADCQLALGRKEAGVALLMRSLELISVDERPLWDQARTRLYQVIDVK